MLALDISQSMETPDFRTPDGKRMRRVDAVKEVVSEFIRKRTHDRIGLIVFGQSAYPVTPFTLDHDACLKILGQIDAGMAGPQTMIGDAIGLAIKQFQNTEAKQRALILLTDGNDTGSHMPPVFRTLLNACRGNRDAQSYTLLLQSIKVAYPDGRSIGCRSARTMLHSVLRLTAWALHCLQKLAKQIGKDHALLPYSINREKRPKVIHQGSKPIIFLI